MAAQLLKAAFTYITASKEQFIENKSKISVNDGKKYYTKTIFFGE